MAKGHIRTLAPNSFELRIDLPKDPETGKRRVLSRAFHGGIREAEKELTRLKNDINKGEYADSGKMTVSQWLNEWLNTSRSDRARGTFLYYRRAVDHYLVPAFGARRLAKLTPLDIKRAISKWSQDGPRHDEKPGGLSEHAVWRNYSLFKVVSDKGRRIRPDKSKPV
jgi:integrase